MVERIEKSPGCDPGRLLSAPHVVLQLLGACQDLSGSAEDLREIVLQDSGLCARILAAAARTCPERLDPAAPVGSALAGLGRPALSSLALQAAKTLIDTPLDAAQTQFLRELWFYSQSAGALCRSLAEAVAYPAAEEAQLTGMMLNLGMLSLFSAHPQRYPGKVGHSLGSPQLLGEEQGSFETDHCQVGTTLVGAWRIDSFMAEAIRFIYLEPEACREAAILVRIARLAQELCKSPLKAAAGSESLATELLNLDPDGFKAAFRRAAERYRPLAPFDNRQDECLQELERTRRRLTSLAFSLAEQEGIRTQLAGTSDREGTVATARSLYLRSTPAREAIFFLPAGVKGHFVGYPAPGQPRRITGLATSLEGANLVAEALRGDKTCHSFGTGGPPSSVFDRQLLGLCGTAGIAVLPLRFDHQVQGAVVLGLEAAEEVEALGSPGLYQLGRELAARLGASPSPAAGQGSVPPAGPVMRKIAHEIRTPLAIINNYMRALGLLLEGSENAGVVDSVENEIRRIDEILTYYTEAGEAPAPSEEEPQQSPDVLALSVIESLTATHFAPKQLEIVTDFNPDIEPLPVSPVAIRQILVNLLKNAAEALPEKGRIILATREYQTSAGVRQVVISVEDNGPGIDRAVLDRLFSPIASPKGKGHAGLGLHIVKGLADDIGGRVACQSSPDNGTRFELTIPRPAVG